jgi:hypothetical protein
VGTSGRRVLGHGAGQAEMWPPPPSIERGDDGTTSEAGEDATIDGGARGCCILRWRRWWGRISPHCFWRKPQIRGRTPLLADARGHRGPRGRRCGGLLDWIMVTAVSPPLWGNHLWTHSSAGRTGGRLGGCVSVSACFSRGDQGGAA